MRVVIAYVLLLVSLTSSYAKTCTAPGHPTCTIVCPGACAAGYLEPNGPCKTACFGGPIAAAAADASSIEAQFMTAKDLAEFLRAKK